MNLNNDEKKVLNRKCKKCGGTLYANTSVVLTTYPSKYSCRCEKCGSIEYHNCSDVTLDYSLLQDGTIQYSGSTVTATMCNHNFDIKLINGAYVSYCTKCGKIGDSKNIFNTFTCSVTGTTLDPTKGVTTSDK